MAGAGDSPEREARWRSAMAAAQQGDGEAYRRLLEELLPRIRLHVRARISDPHACEDVVQNALLSIHRARRTYRPARPFTPWMRAVVRNAVIDHLREGGRRRAREAAMPDADAFAHPQQAPEPGPLLLSPELARALAGLPAGQREAVELMHLHDLTVAEAADRAGVSRGALKVRAHRGYRALRKRLAGGPLELRAAVVEASRSAAGKG